MNKVLILLCTLILLNGCIVIEDEEENKTTLPDINVTFDLDDEETEEPETEKDEGTIKPDLEIIQIFWATLFPDVGESDRLIFKVINNGNVSVDGFNYKVILFKEYDSWKEETFEHEDVLGPEKSVTIRQDFMFNETGQFRADVTVDWDNSIKESEELNNFKTSSIMTVSDPDPGDEEEEESDDDTNETQEPELTKINKCVDSDDGINYNVKGRCMDDGPFILGMSDFCEHNFKLIELYCTNRTIPRCKFAEPYECYCKDGACV